MICKGHWPNRQAVGWRFTERARSQLGRLGSRAVTTPVFERRLGHPALVQFLIGLLPRRRRCGRFASGAFAHPSLRFQSPPSTVGSASVGPSLAPVGERWPACLKRDRLPQSRCSDPFTLDFNPSFPASCHGSPTDILSPTGFKSADIHDPLVRCAL